jgi:two-component system nitrate/nitrite sensor histidine kinase NarX
MSETKQKDTRYIPRLWNCRIYVPFFLLAISVLILIGFSIWLVLDSPQKEWASLLVGLFTLIAVISLIGFYILIQKNLLSPLSSLTTWANRLHDGDLSARIPVHGTLEFTALAKNINQLSDNLQALTDDMQSQVERQTRHIAQKTHSLEIIYDVAASINVSRDLNDLLTRFLHTLKDVVKARAAVVRLVDQDNQMRLIASTGLDDEVISREQLMPAADCLCGSAYDEGAVQYQYDITKCDKIIGHSFFNDDSVGMIAVPLQYRDKTLGVYNLFVEKEMMDDVEEINELLTSIGRHLGMAIDKARLDNETNRLSIMEERTRLAHELHDSLAQTMASLRFQVRVLDESLRKGEEPAVWHELEQIENNLDEAYAELRELITHFRAPIDKRGLVPAVEHLATRFRNQTGIHVFLQQEWNVVQLPANIEVEVLRIIQESLNNIKKHSQAHTVRVILRSTPQGACHILIEDDGVGIDTTLDKDTREDHYGLNIMSERAKRINGKLKIESEPGEGTRITLTFKYSSNTKPPKQTNTSNSGVVVQLPSAQSKS